LQEQTNCHHKLQSACFHSVQHTIIGCDELTGSPTLSEALGRCMRSQAVHVNQLAATFFSLGTETRARDYGLLHIVVTS